MTCSQRKRFSLIAVVLALVLLLTGCGRSQETPAPQPSPALTVQPLSETPAAEATPSRPAAPTPMARLDLPPVVVDTAPARGQEHPLDAPIRVRFDQPMDPASTQTAFSIEPAVAGEVRVAANELVFTPAQPLARGASYRFAVSDQARSRGGKALAAPVQVRFNTVGFLQVTTTQPANGSEEVSVDTPITVIFNRPVVPLTGVAQMADLPQPLRFDPPLAGQGEWLNTSIYTFRPDQPLAGATAYRVTVPAGLQDTKGSLLAEDFVFSFRTASPVVTGFAPEGTLIAPTTAITLTFSQPMDPASTEAGFSLRKARDEQPVAGAFTWSAGQRTLRFQPAQPLEYATRYTAQVANEARSAGGTAQLRQAYVNGLETAPKLAIVRTAPADGHTNVAPETSLIVTFRGIVDEKTLGADAFTIIPEPTGVFSYYASWEGRWQISWPMQPQTNYTVTLSAAISDIFGNRLGEDRVIRFQTGNRKPFAHLNVPNDIGTYNVYTNTLIAASYRNVSSLDFQLYTVNESDAQRLLGYNRWEALRTYRPKQDALIRAWSVPVSPPANANVLQKFPLAADGGPLPAGIYWIEMRAPEVKYDDGGESGQLPPRHLLLVSPFNLITKKTADEILVWATDLQSGRPVPNLPVRVTGSATAEGVTDADGIMRAPIKQKEVWEPLVVFAGQPGSQYGVTSTDWTDGLGPWDFGLMSEFPPPTWQGYFYTDRPLYRPGQTIYWKGILRADNDAVYQLPPAGLKVRVTIRNPQGEIIYEQPHELSPFGTLHGELSLAEEAPLGYYFLEGTLMDLPQKDFMPSFGIGIQVAEYRKPEFVAELATDKGEYLNGDTIRATVKGDFFFGGPVTNAKVRWTVFSEDAFFNYDYAPTGPWYSFSDFTGWDAREQRRYGQVVASGSGVTDSLGRFTFSIPADITDRKQSQRFTIDATVTDLNNQEVATSASAIVHKGLVYVGVAPRTYVSSVGEESVVDVITVDWDSRPVPDQTVTVEVNKAKWITVQEKGKDGQFYWVSSVQETPVLSQKVTTDAQGKTTLAWKPAAGGEYKINVQVTDAKGNVVRSATFLWVADKPTTFVPWRVDNNDRIELVADKKLYQVGDTAKVLAPHPFQGPVEVLITVERGTIIEARRLTLNSNSPTLEIPILPDYVPDVFVSVVIVKGASSGGNELGSFKLGYVQLPVDTKIKELQVTLTPSQPELKPGETVTFTVEVKDSNGQPVQGEFSLALVDKALLALVQGTDQGSLLDTFYRQRGLGVQTASSLVLNLDRLNQQLQEDAKGGGGGDSEGVVDVRTEFVDTALWEPAVVTDAAGRAVVSVKLPDNLTAWRLDGRGVTKETQVGSATVEIMTTLPLLVRPVLPRFFTAGDQAEIGAVVNNNTDQPRTVAVSLAATGLTTTATLTQTVVVPAGGQQKVVWPAEVTTPAAQTAIGAATVRFTAIESRPGAASGGLSDAAELTLPVYRYSTPETVATAGTVAGNEERLEVIVLPPDIDPTQGDLRVQLAPSLAAGMIEGLDYVTNFPYDCTEQVVSKFLANLVNARALAELDITRPELEANLREQVTTGVQRLAARQNADGGWGWWTRQESNVFVSGYVVFGLVEAKRGGFAVDDAVLARGIDYLQRQFKSVDILQGYALNQQAFLLYVLAEAGAESADMARSVALYDVRERLGHYGRAYLALTFGLLAEAGESAAGSRVQTLLDDLNGAAVVSATGAHWEEAGVDWWTMNTDTRSTSLALMAFTRLAPADKLPTGLLPNVVRWLMMARQAGPGRWQTTQENVWAIIALTDWMKATGELNADYSYRVSLNQGELASGAVDQNNVDAPIDLRMAVADMLLDAANGLLISRFAEGSQSGAGQLYYTTFLNYYLPAADVPPLDRGLVVARDYALIDPVTGEVKPGEAMNDAQIGDTVLVTLTLILPTDAYYLTVESPLPAGFEAIDPSLATTSRVYEDAELRRQDAPYPWYWLPTSTDLRDEKVALFAEYLPAGTYQFRYQMRASLPGQFQTLPAVVYQMYFPDVWGRSAGELFTINAE